jgi:hypothetical protein
MAGFMRSHPLCESDAAEWSKDECGHTPSGKGTDASAIGNGSRGDTGRARWEAPEGAR